MTQRDRHPDAMRAELEALIARLKADLPLSLPPRGLSRERACKYIGGISPTKFDELVRQGQMPQPKRIGSRKLWDRDALDLAFNALPEDGPSHDDNPWDVAA